MKVYLVFHTIPYEGSDVVDIFSTYNKAFKEMKKIAEEEVYDRYAFSDTYENKWGHTYHIEEHEVL